MNIAIIIAGGVGARIGQHIPKQFINVMDKPIIVYTMERFQACRIVDAIEVVCVDGWDKILETYALQYGISKLKWIVPGGDSCQESIYKGLKNLLDKCDREDVVIIHDGIRPMVSDELIRDCVDVCKVHGNGVSALPVIEQVFKNLDDKKTASYIPREELSILQTPQAYRYGKILEVYEKSQRNNIGVHPSAYANTLMTDMGETIYYSMGSTKNIKITTEDDIEIFRAMLEVTK